MSLNSHVHQGREGPLAPSSYPATGLLFGLFETACQKSNNDLAFLDVEKIRKLVSFKVYLDKIRGNQAIFYETPFLKLHMAKLVLFGTWQP
jgi:hypothetical protein